MQGQWLQPSTVRLSYRASDDPNAARLNRHTTNFQVGGTLRVSRMSLSYQYSVHSAAFSGPKSRRHNWGGIYLSIQ
ncbi:MAG: DUF2219 family protein, partial [Anaerolineae bacterium]|nr:DUF2219 family protein [Gemmatimonadaceae bacterium]